VIVRAAKISYSTSPIAPAHPNVLFVHGSGAHRHWWDPMLPLVADHWNVTALDLSGHGESDHRPEGYHPEAWADELGAVIAATSPRGRSIVVAHSMGALVAIAAAAIHPDAIDRLILLDIAIQPDRHDNAPRGRAGKTPRTFETEAEAIAAFHLLPPGSVVDDATLRLVGSFSYRRGSAGWAPKFDQEIFQRFTDGDVAKWLAEVRCPITLIGGEHSGLVGRANAEYVAAVTGNGITWGNLPNTHHHLQLEDPHGVASTLLALVHAPAPTLESCQELALPIDALSEERSY
jgi:pimeloyl-ACP methyl ester carboxylesterase